MAQWEGSFRTNYFAVKDEAAFRGWVKRLEVEGKLDLFVGEGPQAGLFGLGAYSAVPVNRKLTEEERAEWAGEKDSEAEDFEDPSYLDRHGEHIDFPAELAAHLAPGQVAVVQEVGWEKLRYLTGFGYAIDHTGKVLAQGNIEDALNLPEGITATRPVY